MQEKKDQLSSARRMIIPQEPAVKLPEESYTGIGASKGIAIGECYVFIKEIGSHEPRELNEKNINEEIQRFRTALERSEKELKKIGLKYNQVILGIGRGTRFVINDIDPDNPTIKRAVGINLIRDKGYQGKL